jgi:hypothetical protein
MYGIYTPCPEEANLVFECKEASSADDGHVAIKHGEEISREGIT